MNVEFLDEEFVVPRGTAQIRWFVRQNEAWVHASRFPGAQLTELERRAGQIQRTKIELELPLKTRVMRVESRPATADRKSTIEHLLKSRSSTARRTIRRYFRVGRAGTLKNDPA